MMIVKSKFEINKIKRLSGIKKFVSTEGEKGGTLLHGLSIEVQVYL